MIDPTVTRQRGGAITALDGRAIPAAGVGMKHGLVIAALLAMFISACSTTSPTRQNDGDHRVSQTATAAVRSEFEVEKRLRGEVAQWTGTPHVLGGTTARGIDCSAFVQNVYSDAFDISLPRTTSDQARRGNEVRQRELRPGDLVFFKPPTKTRHVGIYLSNGEFAHASSSQGVTISDINHDYWQRSYWTSRRVLPDAGQPVAAERTEAAVRRPLSPPPTSEAATTEAPREPSKPRRVGW